jgi:hypothetical protein
MGEKSTVLRSYDMVKGKSKFFKDKYPIIMALIEAVFIAGLVFTVVRDTTKIESIEHELKITQEKVENLKKVNEAMIDLLTTQGFLVDEDPKSK